MKLNFEFSPPLGQYQAIALCANMIETTPGRGWRAPTHIDTIRPTLVDVAISGE